MKHIHNSFHYHAKVFNPSFVYSVVIYFSHPIPFSVQIEILLILKTNLLNVKSDISRLVAQNLFIFLVL